MLLLDFYILVFVLVRVIRLEYLPACELELDVINLHHGVATASLL